MSSSANAASCQTINGGTEAKATIDSGEPAAMHSGHVMESGGLKKTSKEAKIKLNVTVSDDKCIKGLELVSDIIKH
eukprot:15349414-Ditylum_brightwellii.AAC.1